MQRRVWTGVLTAAAVLCGGSALPAIAGAQQPAPPGVATVTAAGSANVKPKPENRNSDASIRKAVAEASARALPLAVARAQTHAGELAAAAGLKLGGLLSIADSPQPGYPFIYQPQNGTFPDGHYCGKVRRSRVVHTTDGKRRRVADGTPRICRIPGSVSASVTLTYAVAP